MTTLAMPRLPGMEMQGADGRKLNQAVATIREQFSVLASQVLPLEHQLEEVDYSMEFDAVFPMPPKRRYSVEVTIESVRKAIPRGGSDTWSFEEAAS